MGNIGVKSGLMEKFFQFVALLLIPVVLGGAQCVELCSFLSSNVQATAGIEMPCHQKPAPDDSQPAGGERCSNNGIVAEKRSHASSADDLHAAAFVAFPIDALTPPILASSPSTISDEHFPGFSPLILISILRI